MPLFGRGLSQEDKAEALKLVQHVQTLFAFQQLTMEAYNDAVVAASTGASLGSELSHGHLEGQSSSLAVSQSILPAVAYKLGIIEEMERRHQAFGRPTVAPLTKAYDICTGFLGAMRNRAEKQQANWEKWIADPTVDSVETSFEDRQEAKAADAGINSINDVIFKSLELEFGDFMEINRQATNHVRSTLDLDPLAPDEYGTMYMSGIQGSPVRYFTS